MRRILVDRARGRGRAKRGGGMARLDLDVNLVMQPEADEELLAVDDALTRLAAAKRACEHGPAAPLRDADYPDQ